MTLNRHGPPVRSEARRAGKARLSDLNFPENTGNHDEAQTGPRVATRSGT